MSELEIPKPLVRDTYGAAADALLVGEHIIIPLDDRVKIVNYLTRKYKKERLFRSVTIDGIVKLFRVK